MPVRKPAADVDVRSVLLRDLRTAGLAIARLCDRPNARPGMMEETLDKIKALNEGEPVVIESYRLADALHECGITERLTAARYVVDPNGTWKEA